MGKKMYYNEEEAINALGIAAEELAKYVRDGKLRVFQDGPRTMYRVDEVDALGSAGDEIELTPADSTITGATGVDTAGIGSGIGSGLDAELGSEIGTGISSGFGTSTGTGIGSGIGSGAAEITLEDAETTPGATKEDTVITAEGISIFDEEDLEIEAADPMAKTQIAPSLEDQISLEGVGSGSGLLDLTRESDDTSLGAEVLDHIDVDGEGMAELAPEPPALQPQPFEPQTAGSAAPAGAGEGPTVVEEIDPNAGLFTGLLVGCMLACVILGLTTIARAMSAIPGYLLWFNQQMLTVVILALVVIAIAGAAGLVLGRAIAQRQAQLRMRDLQS